MLFAVLFNFAGLGLFCWLLYALAVDAVAVFAALSIGVATFRSGGGLIGAATLSLIAGVAIFAFARYCVFATRSRFVRPLITLLYAIPAAIAGYGVSDAFACIGGATGSWRIAFALIGSFAVAAVARARLQATSASSLS
ncbi:MAG: hypothetical protein FJX45_18830 [Alphaproteobacteria bacterium]|nr:hypothetical protein [Alphaproteobacteria bacterium]